MKTTTLKKLLLAAACMAMIQFTFAQTDAKQKSETPATQEKGKAEKETMTTDQIAAEKVKNEEKNTLPIPVQKLMRFVGEWDANIILILNGKEHKIAYHVNGKKVADGNGISVDESFNDPELGKLIGANLAGYNPHDKKIHWFSVDNMGTTHEHVGDWSSDELMIQHEGKQGDKTYNEKINFVFKTPTTMNFLLVGTLDGKENIRATGVFQKKKISKPATGK